MSKRFAVLAGTTAALALVLVAPGIAAKGGKNSTPTTVGTATVTASPNPATVGSNIMISGCGYQFAVASVRVTQPDGSALLFYVGMWSTGCLDTAYFTANQAGTYTIQVFQGSSTPSASTAVRVV